MSNTLTGLIPTLYESLDIVNRELIGIIPAVQRDSSVARAAKGQTVTSFIAPAVQAADITPGVTAPNDGDQVLDSLQMTITKSRYVPIRWNGEEQRGINNGGPGVRSILTNQFVEGFRALINEVEADVVAAARKRASRAYGTPGTAPFAVSGDLTDVASMLTILDDNGAPISDRQLVLGSGAMGNLRGKQSLLFKVNEAGDDRLLRDGVMGRLEGFDVHNSSGVKTVIKGTGTGYLVNGTGLAERATSIPVDTGTGTILAGDIVMFSGDPNKYVNRTTISGAGIMELNKPGLMQPVADNTAITVGNSFVPNLAFNRNAIVLATRQPAVPVDINGNAMDMADDRTLVVDPVSGIAFEVSMYRQYRQVKYEIGLAWGTEGVNSDNIALLLG